MAQVAAGDRGALEALIKQHQDPLYRYVLHLARDSALAEDTLQETFLAVWRHAGAFRGESSLRTWLFTIARRTLWKQKRRHVGEPDRFEPLEALGAAAGWGQETPEDWQIRLDDARVLEEALAKLPESAREILILRDVEGLSGEETAAILDLSLAAMKSRLHRARLELTAALKKGGHHG